MANEIVQSKNNLLGLLDKSKASIRDIIPKHLTPEKVCKMALVAASKTPKLYQCTQASVLKSIMAAAECGLDFTGTTGQGYLIPYGNECTFIAGYRGLMEMARRTGKVSRLESRVVYENDKFNFSYGLNHRLEHQPFMTGDRGPIKCVYAVAQLNDGSTQLEVMTRQEVDDIRNRSKAKNNGPWVTDYSEMARKTVLRRLCKYLPSSPEMEKLLSADQDLITDIEVIDAKDLPDNRTDDLAARLSNKVENEPPADEISTEPEPTKKTKVEQLAEDLRGKCLDMVDAMVNNKAEKEKLIAELSSFTDAEGRVVVGKTKISQISDKAMMPFYGKLKEAYDRWQGLTAEEIIA